MNLKESEEILNKGYKVIPFPSELPKIMIAHIMSYIAEITKQRELSSVMSLSDEEFIRKFHKGFRIFPSHISQQISNWVEGFATILGGVKTAINFVSAYEISKNPSLKKNTIDSFWRCVRPGKPDVGAAHCDYQFWEIAKGTDEDPGKPFEYDERWKIWIPLVGCNHQTSLQVIPGSHTEEIPIDYLQTKNGVKPSITPEWLAKNEHRFLCPFEKFTNSCVLFHDKLVHRGPPNPCEEVRLSSELTILLKLEESAVI